MREENYVEIFNYHPSQIHTKPLKRSTSAFKISRFTCCRCASVDGNVNISFMYYVHQFYWVLIMLQHSTTINEEKRRRDKQPIKLHNLLEIYHIQCQWTYASCSLALGVYVLFNSKTIEYPSLMMLFIAFWCKRERHPFSRHRIEQFVFISKIIQRLFLENRK